MCGYEEIPAGKRGIPKGWLSTKPLLTENVKHFCPKHVHGVEHDGNREGKDIRTIQ